MTLEQQSMIADEVSQFADEIACLGRDDDELAAEALGELIEVCQRWLLALGYPPHRFGA